MGLKEDTRNRYEQAKTVHETTVAAYRAKASADNYEAMLKTQKLLDKARRQAFQYWSTGDPPLL